MTFSKASKEIGVFLCMCLSVSAAWPIATEFDSDEGLRDITFLWVSWKIAGWMSRESKINLSSRDSCISIVRNQRTIGMKVTGDRSSISSPSWACHWCTWTSLHFLFLYKLLPLTSLQTLIKDISWHPKKQIAPSPSSHSQKRPGTWQAQFHRWRGHPFKPRPVHTHPKPTAFLVT